MSKRCGLEAFSTVVSPSKVPRTSHACAAQDCVTQQLCDGQTLEAKGNRMVFEFMCTPNRSHTFSDPQNHCGRVVHQALEDKVELSDGALIAAHSSPSQVVGGVHCDMESASRGLDILTSVAARMYSQRQGSEHVLVSNGRNHAEQTDQYRGMECVRLVESRNDYEHVWERRLSELQKYKEMHGDCNVPRGYPENPKLANWVKKQRQEYTRMREGKKSAMNQERINALNELGFVWSHKISLTSWEERLEELRLYKNAFGDCNVPKSFARNPRLANWVNKQRAEYKLLLKGKSSKLTPERVALLNGMGFAWRLGTGYWRQQAGPKEL